MTDGLPRDDLRILFDTLSRGFRRLFLSYILFLMVLVVWLGVLGAFLLVGLTFEALLGSGLEAFTILGVVTALLASVLLLVIAGYIFYRGAVDIRDGVARVGEPRARSDLALGAELLYIGGVLTLVGAVLTIVLVGVLILAVGNIIALIGIGVIAYRLRGVHPELETPLNITLVGVALHLLSYIPALSIMLLPAVILEIIGFRMVYTTSGNLLKEEGQPGVGGESTAS
ncbi:hypothetical protein apy_06640 [Aeropyrum pernix]|uniref:DUF973 family protein n=1 Tax=Aeropyrum pernix TaxID=56636 RepID=A0A401H9C7_AERPX|nr:hypothetical protein [Aeropyrum pernix]GBF08939.1 hypothetical protein apy_06640 [Aeropyrum pernix]